MARSSSRASRSQSYRQYAVNVEFNNDTGTGTGSSGGSSGGGASSGYIVREEDGTSLLTLEDGSGSILNEEGTANIKISSLSALTTAATTDEWYLNNGGASKKITVANLLKQAPGYEVGYDQVTSPVTISSTTESTGTTLISCSAHTFDGSPVIAEFFCPAIFCPGFSNAATYVSLFESTTQIGRFSVIFASSGGLVWSVPVSAILRFTPSAGSHTYTVTAHKGTAQADGQAGAGAGGTAADPPMFVRFTKA